MTGKFLSNLFTYTPKNKLFWGVFLIIINSFLASGQIHLQGGASIVSVSDSARIVTVTSSPDGDRIAKNPQKKIAQKVISEHKDNKPTRVYVTPVKPSIKFQSQKSQNSFASPDSSKFSMITSSQTNIIGKAISSKNEVMSIGVFYRTRITVFSKIQPAIFSYLPQLSWARPPPFHYVA